MFFVSLLQLELKKSLVDHLVQLFSCGHILPVVGYMQRCMLAETLDQSLIRHFVSEVCSNYTTVISLVLF